MNKFSSFSNYVLVVLIVAGMGHWVDVYASEDAKQRGEAFLTENAQREGVVVLPSGLQYEIIEEGKPRRIGPTPINTTFKLEALVPMNPEEIAAA